MKQTMVNIIIHLEIAVPHNPIIVIHKWYYNGKYVVKFKTYLYSLTYLVKILDVRGFLIFVYEIKVV